MNKKDYQLFGCVLAKIENANERENLIRFVSDVLKIDNERFDEMKFREFIRRLIANESLRGLRVNKKYLY
jgi:hypothetical protein